MFLVLTVSLSIMLGAVSVVGVFMSGLSGESSSKIAVKAACMLVLILICFVFLPVMLDNELSVPASKES